LIHCSECRSSPVTPMSFYSICDSEFNLMKWTHSLKWIALTRRHGLRPSLKDNTQPSVATRLVPLHFNDNGYTCCTILSCWL
jgi:hypothetical protein